MWVLTYKLIDTRENIGFLRECSFPTKELAIDDIMHWNNMVTSVSNRHVFAPVSLKFEPHAYCKPMPENIACLLLPKTS